MPAAKRASFRPRVRLPGWRRRILIGRSSNGRLTAVRRSQAAAGLEENNTGLLIVAKPCCGRTYRTVLTTAPEGEISRRKTSDQWFNEAQFAAYTEVGRRIGVKARTVRSYAEEPVPPEETPED